MISNDAWTPIGEAANQVTENLRAQAELMCMDRRDPEERQYVEKALERICAAFEKSMEKHWGPRLTANEDGRKKAYDKRYRKKTKPGNTSA